MTTTSDPRGVAWPERLVVGVDTSPESLAALDRALELAARAGSTVVVVHAVGLLEAGAYRPRPDLDAIVAQARQRVSFPSELLASPVFEDGSPSDVLVRIAHRSGADLIVVGRRGLGGTPRPLGSTSEAVLDKADVPVLVVPPAG